MDFFSLGKVNFLCSRDIRRQTNDWEEHAVQVERLKGSLDRVSVDMEEYCRDAQVEADTDDVAP